MLNGKRSIAGRWRITETEPIAGLREGISLITAAEEYFWVNTRQVWGVGAVNVAVGTTCIDASMR